MKKINKHIITLISLLVVNITTAQVSVPGNIRPLGTPRFLGWNNLLGTPGNLEIRNDWPSSIDFSTNGSAIPNMTLDATGNLGIGTTTASLTPSFQLDVASHININTPVWPSAGSDIGCFMINGLTVLHNQGLSNIYAGVAAGLSGFGVGNAFIGVQAGTVNVADYNVMIGYQAGLVNTTEDYNTFVGSGSGFQNTIGSNNAFFGHHAGVGGSASPASL